MTSRKLYLAKWLENIKRRNWTFLLCIVMTLLFQPVMVAINMTSSYNNWQEDLANGIEAFYVQNWHQNQQDAYLRMCGFSEEMFLLAVGFAVLFAVQGFSFLYSRKKMDFYMSVPVSSAKRYLMIMGNGIVVFGVTYLISAILCMFICAGFGLFTFEMFVQQMLAYLLMMLIFTAVYQVALAAVMLTGNVLTALLGCCVFFFYEYVVRLVADQLKSTYFVTYCRAESSRFLDQPYLTPLSNAFQFLNNTGYVNSALYGSPYGDGISIYAAVGLQILIMLASIAVWGSITYILFRRRKTESYGSAIAFRTAKGLIRFFLLVPCSVVTGMLASIWAGDSQLFLWAGAVVGLLLGHVVIQLIYERDLRAVKKRLFSLGCSGVAAVTVLAAFCFDLTGYDHYVPAAAEVETVSFTVENDYSGLGNLYRVPFDGSRRALEDVLLNELESGNPETIQAIVAMAQDYVVHLEAEGDRYGLVYENDEDFHCWVVRYELKGGREVYRRFYSDAAQMTDEIDTLMRDEAYQNIRCQLFAPAFAESLDKMKITYSTGAMEYLYTMDKEALYQAFTEEMRGYDYSLISEALPKGSLKFVIPNEENPNNNLCTWEFPVYEAFEKTLALIGDNGIPAWEENCLQAEDVDSIQVNYYYYEEAGNDVQVFEQTVAVSEQNITVVITDPEEIEILLGAIYPQSLIEVTDNTIHRYRDFSSDFEVEVNLSAAGKQKRLDVPYMTMLKEKVPEFVIKKIKDAAVTE